MKRAWLGVLVMSVSGMMACGDDDAPRDGGVDAAGEDAGSDAGADAGRDDAGGDAGEDAGGDAGDDAGGDAGADAGPNTVECGDTACALPGEVCCRTPAGAARCAADCGAGETAFTCDGPEDCEDGICCRDVLSGVGGAVCAAACEGAFVPACHVGEMCDDGSMCCPMGVCLGGGCD